MKTLLKNHLLTQKKIADTLNCSQMLVSKWCNKKCEPSLNAVIKISETFNIPIEEIVLAFKKNSGGEENEKTRIKTA